jgi:hypothetical protein
MSLPPARMLSPINAVHAFTLFLADYFNFISFSRVSTPKSHKPQRDLQVSNSCSFNTINDKIT